MSTAYRIPFGATALAIGIENVPDPEPMSATISPGFSRSFAITSGIFASIPRSREFIVSMYFSAGDCASCAKALLAVNTQPTQETHTDICLSILGSPEPADDLIPSRRERSIRSTGGCRTLDQADNEKDSIGSAPAGGWCGATESSGRSASDRIH